MCFHTSPDLDKRVVSAIQVGEYTILVLEATEDGSLRLSFRLWSLGRSSAEGSQESASHSSRSETEASQNNANSARHNTCWLLHRYLGQPATETRPFSSPLSTSGATDVNKGTTSY